MRRVASFTIARAVASAFAALALGACSSVQMDLPEGFLRLRDREHAELRAVTADDARLWVRDFDVQDGASIEFWTEALQKDLAEARGYELEPAVAIRDGAGREGRALLGHVVVDGRRSGWFGAMFLLDAETLRLVEFAARDEIFAQHFEAVRAAVATLR